MKSPLIFLLCFLLVSSCFSVLGQSDSKALLLSAATNMKKFTDHSVAMEYTVKTVVASYENDREMLKQNDSHVLLSISKYKSKFSTREMEMFKDTLVQVAVMKDERKIYLTESPVKSVWQAQQGMISSLQDSLMKWVKITSSETLCDPEDSKHLIEKMEGVMATDALKKATCLVGITYWVDRKYNRITRIRALFNRHPQNVREIDMTILRYEEEKRNETFKGTAYSMVFASGNKPAKRYQGYEVVDYRSGKTKNRN